MVSSSELRDKRDHPELLLEAQAGNVRPHLPQDPDIHGGQAREEVGQAASLLLPLR